MLEAHCASWPVPVGDCLEEGQGNYVSSRGPSQPIPQAAPFHRGPLRLTNLGTTEEYVSTNFGEPWTSKDGLQWGGWRGATFNLGQKGSSWANAAPETRKEGRNWRYQGPKNCWAGNRCITLGWLGVTATTGIRLTMKGTGQDLGNLRTAVFTPEDDHLWGARLQLPAHDRIVLGHPQRPNRRL